MLSFTCLFLEALTHKVPKLGTMGYLNANKFENVYLSVKIGAKYISVVPTARKFG